MSLQKECCITDNCTNAVHVKKSGLCLSCYNALRRKQHPKIYACKNPDCDKKGMYYTKPSFCWTCYNRLRAHGTLENRLKTKEEESKKAIFEYLVSYKVAHDGISPTIQEIADNVNESYVTILARLQALKSEKKIDFSPEEGRLARKIMVIGGRWTYTQEDTK